MSAQGEHSYEASNFQFGLDTEFQLAAEEYELDPSFSNEVHLELLAAELALRTASFRSSPGSCCSSAAI